MINIGIMTMHRIVNYGSFLQAYGLKRIIENNINSHVELVDYKYEGSLEKDQKKSFWNRIKDNRTVINYVRKKRFLQKVNRQYEFDLRTMGVNGQNYGKDIESLVIGSDEVFNCMQGYPVGYSRNLFGYGYENCKVLSYAGSFGHTTLENLTEENIFFEIKKMMKKFEAVSVRDNNSKFIVEKMGIKNIYKHLDPVLVYDFRQEHKSCNINVENYIIIYVYTGRLSHLEEKYIKKFASRHNKKIVSVCYYSAIADYNIVCNPINVFDYFEKADYIITDTFHGTIFSIKTKAKFCTIIRNSNRNKIMDMLSTLGQTERIVNDLEDIETLFGIEISYNMTNQIIERETQKSIRFLKEYLKNDK